MKKLIASLSNNQRAKESDLEKAKSSGPSADQSAEDKEILELIIKAQNGGQDAFKRLVDKYRSQVIGVAFKMVGDYEDAKDISQLVFVKTYQNLHRFEIGKKFSTWLYRITINASIDFLRKYRRYKHESIEDNLQELKENKGDAEEVYRRGLIRAAIEKSLERLSFKQKSVFVLRDLEGLDIKSVSQVMAMPQATVRWYLHRARSRIRQELQKNYPHILERST
jgi:RNA polymerase sigma-70 factor (ECF subfamily)